MKRSLSVLASIIFVLNTFAFGSSQRAYPNHASPLVLEASQPFVKKFKNLKEFYLYADTILPDRGYDRYAQWIEKSGLAQVSLNELVVQSNKVYWPGIKEPFIIMNDKKSVSYKGISATFYPELGPERMSKTANEAWGHFSEFKPKKSANAFLMFLGPQQANAQTKKESEMMVGVGSLVALGGFSIGMMDVIFGVTALGGVLSGAMIYGGLALALYAGSRWVWLHFDKKANKLANSRLECSWGEGFLVSDSQKISFDDLPELTRKESEQSAAALREICKNPEAVKKFNEAFTLTKKKIYSGKASYFTKTSASPTKNRSQNSGAP